MGDRDMWMGVVLGGAELTYATILDTWEREGEGLLPTPSTQKTEQQQTSAFTMALSRSSQDGGSSWAICSLDRMALTSQN